MTPPHTFTTRGPDLCGLAEKDLHEAPAPSWRGPYEILASRETPYESPGREPVPYISCLENEGTVRNTTEKQKCDFVAPGALGPAPPGLISDGIGLPRSRRTIILTGDEMISIMTLLSGAHNALARRVDQHLTAPRRGETP